MNRRAMQLNACVERARMCLETGKTRQQRRMHIEHPAAIVVDEPGCEHTHKTCEHDEIGLETVDRLPQLCIERVAVRIVAVVDDRGRYPAGCRKSKSGRVWPIGNHRRDPRWP